MSNSAKTLQKVLVLLVAVLMIFLSVPVSAYAGYAKQNGNGGYISGFSVSTYSEITTNPTIFISTTAISCSPKPNSGALRAKNTMILGVSTPYDRRISSSWKLNTSGSMAAAGNRYSFSSDPGWGTIGSTGTGSIYIANKGWQDYYAGTAYTPTVRVSLQDRLDEYVLNSDTGETFVRVIGINGCEGLVKESEENALEHIASLEETLQYVKEHEGMRYIQVYAEDFVTVIDAYPVTYELE